jgi:D-glycero-D-manno-heptose 1,7-bisphosphate phosphatase
MKHAVILDRDGVINDHRDYVNSPADLYLFDFAGPAIRRLNQAGFLVLVATNQGGVGLGFLSEDTLYDIHLKMLRELAKDGARIDDIAACTHAPKAGCSCRKPKPGMLLELQRRHGFDLSDSYMVGDMETDVEAGKAAGTRTVRIGTGPSAADHVADNLASAVEWIVADAFTRE